jgi:predicted O-linked N-acetylglucosamine transferase (SPINDLY family)
MTRAEAGLPETGMVYCCFNATHKITQPVFNRWLAILGQVPGSVLWLLDAGAETNQRLRGYATDHGIDADRIVFAERMSLPQHLARHALADLFLDTFPYGAHTTASDCLWMGTPILTVSGRSFASRVCGSLLRSAGLPETVCLSAEDYQQRAIALGHDRLTLASYRTRLLAQRTTSVLFDTPLLVSRLEDLFQSMWHDYETGHLPRPDLRNLDVYLDLGVAAGQDPADFVAEDTYNALWRQRLEQRHALRDIAPDDRLWRGTATAWLAAA